jgi:hypothetical protein
MSDAKEPFSVDIVVSGSSDNPEDCLRGLVQTMLDGFAKQLSTVLTIISDKYGHSKEELSDLLRNDPKFLASLKEEISFTSKEKEKEKETKTKTGKKVVIKKKKEKPIESIQ